MTTNKIPLIPTVLLSLALALLIGTTSPACADGGTSGINADQLNAKQVNAEAPNVEPPNAGPPNNDFFWSRWKAQEATMEAASAEPITINGGARRPMFYFRQIANRRWHILPLFWFLFAISGLLKLFLPDLTRLATARCRTNCYASLSSAFIYSTILVAIIRFGFVTDDLTTMGVFTFGLLQLSYLIGACVGANLFAHNLYTLVTSKKEPSHAATRALIYCLCLVVVAGVVAAISMIPDIGRLPRIGNRMVMLVAALGLGGLVNLCAGSQKQSYVSSGPV